MILLITKQKITPSQQKKYKKDHKSILEIFQKMKIFKKINYANKRNNNMSDVNGKRRKEYMNIFYHKRKCLLNYLVNRVKELEKFALVGKRASGS